MDESVFDAAVLGTGLVESILAAALSKAGYRVAHLDSNPYYGGDEASLSLDEFVQWADKNASTNLPGTRFHSVTRSLSVPSQTRQYSICLRPTIIPSIGPMISALVASTVAKYSGFRLLDCVSVYSNTGQVRNVPGSKEDIFKNKGISLIEKRRLMRFLMFASGDFEGKEELEGKEDVPFPQFLQTVFSLSEDMASVINYALGFCVLATEPTLPTLRRLRAYLRSTGRYGPSPFLIGHYGGIGDIAQGFCRASAVSGGVYILGRQIVSITRPGHDASSAGASVTPKPTHKFRLVLDDFPDPISCNLIISSPSYVPQNLSQEVNQLAMPTQNIRPLATDIARCVAIVDKAPVLKNPDPNPEPLEGGERGVTEEVPFTTSGPDLQPVDTAVLIFPPHTVSHGSNTTSATALITGEASLSTPKGKWLIYLALPLPVGTSSSDSPQTLLKPYLDAVLSPTDGAADSPITPLFTTFYMEKQPPPPPTEAASVSSVESYLVPPALQSLSIPDLADEAARIAESVFGEAIKVLQPLDRHTNDGDASEPVPFWPPLETDDPNDDEW